MKWVLVVGAIAVGLALLDQLLLWLERHDVIYYRKTEPISGGAAANAFNIFTGPLDPGRERAQEIVREHDQGEDRLDADPKDPTKQIYRVPKKPEGEA